MPKLPSYQDVGNVSPTIRRDPGVNAPVEAFQSGMPVGELAPGLRIVADVIKQEEIRKDQAAVNDRRRELLEFETEQNEWLLQQKGENAFKAKEQLDKAVDARLTQIRGSLKNDRQKNAFNEVERDWRVSLNRTSSRVIAAEMDRHYDDVDNKLVETSSRSAQKAASLGDFDRVQQEWSDQEKVIAGLADRKGLDETQRKAMLDGRKSNFHSGIALQLISDGDDKSAQKYLEANRKEFDADDSLKIQNMLRSRQAEQSAEHRVAVADKMQDIEAMGSRGVIPPKDFISDQEIEAAYPKSPERVAQLKRRRDEGYRFAAAAAGLHQQDNDALSADMQKPRSVSKDATNFAEEAKHNDALNLMRAQILRQRLKAPMEYAAQQGIGSVNEIDFKNSDSLTAEMKNREKTLKIMNDRFGSPMTQVFLPGEENAMSAAMNQMPVTQKLSYLHAIRSGLGSDNVYLAAMTQIADKGARQMAYAGALLTQDPEGARLLLNGIKHREANKTIVPKDADLISAMSDLMEATSETPEARADITEAVRNVYATMAAESGKFDGTLDSGLMDRAIEHATGGVIEFSPGGMFSKNSMILAPKRGVTEREFEKWVDGLTVEDLTRYGGVKGLDKKEALDLIKNKAQLRTAGPGSYLVQIGGGYLMRDDGEPFMLVWPH